MQLKKNCIDLNSIQKKNELNIFIFL